MVEGLNGDSLGRHDNDEDEKIKRKFTTTAIPQDILDRLKRIILVPREPPYSVIERLLDEHDLKTMRRVVLKRVK